MADGVAFDADYPSGNASWNPAFRSQAPNVSTPVQLEPASDTTLRNKESAASSGELLQSAVVLTALSGAGLQDQDGSRAQAEIETGSADIAPEKASQHVTPLEPEPERKSLESLVEPSSNNAEPIEDHDHTPPSSIVERESSTSAGTEITDARDGMEDLGDVVHKDLQNAESVPDAEDINAQEPKLVEDSEDRNLYEHQGKATLAETAIGESPTSALLGDTDIDSTMEMHPPPAQASSGFDDVPRTKEVASAKGRDASPRNIAESMPEEDGTKDTPNAFEHVDPAPPSTANRSLWDDLDDGDDFSEAIGVGSVPQSDFGASVAPSAETNSAGPVTTDSMCTTASNTGTADASGEGQIEDLWAAAFEDDELLDTSGAVDPSGFLDEDDDGSFLDDTQTSLATGAGQLNADEGNDRTANEEFNTINNNSKVQHQSFGPRPSSTPTSFLPKTFGQNAEVLSNGQRSTVGGSGSSFVDKSKAGYSSPYDLPTDIMPARKRAAPPVVAPAQPAYTPPPRLSSMQSNSSLVSAAAGGSMTGATSLPPTSKPPQQAQQTLRKTNSNQEGFFADLPVVPKMKPRATFSSTPSPDTARMPPPGPPQPPRSMTQPPQVRGYGAPPQGPPTGGPPNSFEGLRQPERLPLFAQQPSAIPGVAAPPSSNSAISRYSPAPLNPQAPQGNKFPAMPAPPTVPARYGNASSESAPVAQRAHAFIPKTSSPLAYHEDGESRQQRQASIVSPGTINVNTEVDGVRVPGHLSRLSDHMHDGPSTRNVPERMVTPPHVVPKSNSLQSSPLSLSRYAPVDNHPGQSISPPKRSQTQSPSRSKNANATYTSTVTRGPSVPSVVQLPSQPQSQLSLPSRQQPSSDLQYEVPQDARANDPLERWKGQPVFHWAPNGILISSFPSRMPFYAAGHAIPVIKCAAGSVTIHDTRNAFPYGESDVSFPGPLQGKGKGKKKEVLAWLSNKIQSIEVEVRDAMMKPGVSALIRQRAGEKLLLWQTMRLIIEFDNASDMKPEMLQAMKDLLVPFDVSQGSPLEGYADTERQGSACSLSNVEIVSEIRRLLLEGDREKAVWYAAEQKLWSHAMIIASSMGSDIWKQLVHEFVKSHMKSPGDNLRSLAALYEVFGGNYDECTDELVPPFARAGLTLSNGVGAASASIDGLERWRETLSLILGNRSGNDGQAIAAIGKLLAGYGRVEAAHVCFLFARAFVQHGGTDDQEATFVLLGADHKADGPALGSDLDSVLLTEIYEYAQSLSPMPGVAPVIPHLQAYKLIRAYGLADHGLRAEAQAYCESIYAAIKSTTRPSPYYHLVFTNAVEELNRCLSQAPQNSASSGLFSKLSSDKVSGSMWKRFNTFVAGDDDDATSNTSGPGEGDAAGPFGRVSGNSPTISREASVADLYGAMSLSANTINPMVQANSITAQNGHAPTGSTPAQIQDRSFSGRYAPQSAGTLRRNPSSGLPYEPQRTGSGYVPTAALRASSKGYTPSNIPSGDARQPSYSTYTPVSKPESAARSTSDYGVPYSAAQERTTTVTAPILSTFHPPPSLGSPYKPQPSPLSTESSPPSQNGYKPSITQTPESDAQHDFQERSAFQNGSPVFQRPSAGFDQPTSYEPPSADYTPAFNNDAEGGNAPDAESGSYEPPSSSYQPYEPDFTNKPDEEDDLAKPRKKGIMDLSDDDDFPRISASNATASNASADAAAQRAAADRAADEAFRKAAEADAQRDKAGEAGNTGKKGWFGGWFGGKKPDGLDAQQPKAIRAKLGEENSFYFDKELGKWVNKKAGKEEGEKASPTPPPPMRGPTRGPSGMGPPSRAASGTAPTGGPPSRPPTSAGAGTPPFGAGPPGGVRAGTPLGIDPPSRPGTGLSNASSIDDLLGPPGGKKGTIRGKKKVGRYVDVMAK